MTLRQEKINSLLRELASSFIKKNISSDAIMTVTRADILENLRSARVFVSVYPDGKEKEVFSLLKKKEKDFRNYIKPGMKMKFLPEVFFEIDRGLMAEKKIDELLKNK